MTNVAKLSKHAFSIFNNHLGLAGGDGDGGMFLLPSGWVVIAACGFISVQGIS